MTALKFHRRDPRGDKKKSPPGSPPITPRGSRRVRPLH